VIKLNKNNLQRPFVCSILTCFLSWLCPVAASAQVTSTAVLPKTTPVQNDTESFYLKMNYSGYDSKSAESQKINDDASVNSTTNFEAEYLLNSTNGMASKKVHFIFGLYPAAATNYMAAPELYYSRIKTLNDYNAQAEYTIGRRQTVKNKLDDIFNLGLVNPYFSQDRINYTAQGLTGFHSKTGNEYFTVGANFYPIFIPNQGPATIEKNGKLIGVNRWAQSTPQTFTYNNKKNNIDYSIDNYNLYKLMNHPGYSLTLQTGDLEKTKTELSVTYSDSPINDIVISRTVIADLNLNGAVEIFPVVRYSQKITSDFKLKQNNTTFFASYLIDTPHNKLENDDHAVQVMEPIYGYGTGVQVDMSDFVHRGLNIGLNYGKFYGGEIKDTNSNGEANTFSLSNNRLLYQNVFKASVDLEGFQMFSNSVFFNMNWIYDSVQNGSLLSLSAHHEPLTNLNVSVGVDLIGVVDDNETEDSQKSFLSRHSADDRITGALQYAF
jgi:hypothetical protein